MRLTDICDFQGGSQPPKNEWSDIQKDGYIRMLQIRDYTQSNAKVEYIKKTNSTKTCEESDILIARYGASVGKILTGLSGAYNVAMMKVIPNENIISKRFLYQYLKSNIFQSYINNVGQRAAQAGFNKNELDGIEINLPDKKEQEKIANELEKVQDIIGIKEKQIEELNLLIKSQFVEMFKDKNFEKKEIRELVDRNIIKAKKKFSNGEKIKYIDISSIDNTKNQVIGFNEFEMGKEPSRAQQCLEKNDILISTVRPNLKNVAVNRYNDNNIVGTSGFCVLRPIKCLQEYLLYIVLSEEFTSDMISKTTGANYPAISNNDVLDYKIELPPLELQNQFAEFVKLIDKQKFEIQKSLEETKNLQESLMNKYFN